MIVLNEREQELYKEATQAIIIRLEEDIKREEELKKKRLEAIELEAFNFKIWSYYHMIILNYEKVLQNIKGETITDPFLNKDVVDLANNMGRLYQGTVSTSAKVIPQMVGGALSPQVAPHELDNNAWIQQLITLATTPSGGSYSGTTTTYDSPITGIPTVSGYNGAGTLVCNVKPPVGSWCLIGNNTLVRITGRTDYSSTAPAVYIASVCSTDSPINNTTYGTGVSVRNWPGYNNAARTSHTPGSSGTTQGMMNALLFNPGTAPYSMITSSSLCYSLNRWRTFVNEVVQAQKDNPSPIITQEDKQSSLDLQAYLNNYITTMPVYDGMSGIDGLKSEINKRLTVTGPAVVTSSRQQKELFYAPRISYTNMRADIQNGSLTTVLYLTTLLTKYPDPWLAKAKESLWILKNELSA